MPSPSMSQFDPSDEQFVLGEIGSGFAQEATPVLRPGRAIPPAIDLFDAAKEAEEEKAEGDER